MSVKALDSKLFVIRADLGPRAPRDYRLNVPAMRGFEGIEFRKPVTFFVGENGSGKSTIIEALAVAAGFNEEGGSKNFRFETVRRDEQSERPLFFHLIRSARYPSDGYFLRAESFFNVATEIDRLGVTRGYGGVSLHEQSHGEAFLALLMNRFLATGSISSTSLKPRSLPRASSLYWHVFTSSSSVAHSS